MKYGFINPAVMQLYYGELCKSKTFKVSLDLVDLQNMLDRGVDFKDLPIPKPVKRLSKIYN